MNIAKYIFLSCLCCILVTSCRQKNGMNNIPYVKTDVVTVASHTNHIYYPGKTKSTEDVNVAFRVSGPLSRINVRKGDYVSKGTVIAEMDPRDYQVQLNATKAEYEAIKSDAERVIAMYNEGNTTASNYDKARYGLEQITQKLSNHRNQLADTRLSAPISGYIQEVLHEAGETVSAGMPVISMFAGDGIEVEFYISALDFANKDKFIDAYCTFEIMPDKQFPLTLSHYSHEANVSQLYCVRMKISGSYDRTVITPGMSTMVHVTIDSDAIADKRTDGDTPTIIPATAILEKNGKTSVFIYENGIVKQREVSVGKLHNDGTVEISSGLKAGEEIVTAGVHHIKDRDKVKALAKPAESNKGGLL